MLKENVKNLKQRVPFVLIQKRARGCQLLLRNPKPAGAKRDVLKFRGFQVPLAPMLTQALNYYTSICNDYIHTIPNIQGFPKHYSLELVARKFLIIGGISSKVANCFHMFSWFVMLTNSNILNAGHHPRNFLFQT